MIPPLALTSNRPVWFCDVDGVINALNPDDHPKVSWKTSKVAVEDSHLGIDGTYPIVWDANVVDFINRMSEKVEFVWLTSWGHTADMYLPPLTGLRGEWADGFSYVGLIPHRYDFIPVWQQKLNAIESLLSEPDQSHHGKYYQRPVIWTDDELTPEVIQGITRITGEKKSLLLRPEEGRGLSPRDCQLIEAFVSRHTEQQ